MGIRVTTWNVNGIRNPFGYQPWRDKRTFEGMFDILEADVVVFQETKIQRKDLRDDMVLVPGWDCYWSLPKHKKGEFWKCVDRGSLTLRRLLRCCHIHSQCHLCADPSRRRYYRHLDASQLDEQLS